MKLASLTLMWWPLELPKLPRTRGYSYFAVAMVHHTLLGGQLYRQGAVVAILPGRQTWERAWFYGLRMIAHYVDLQQRVVVHVNSARAWEAWTQRKHRDNFHDLQELITLDQYKRIKVLCITPKQLKDFPKGEWSLRNRLADATKAAKEIALSLQPVTLEQELQQQYETCKRVAPLAIQRIRHLLEDRLHFMREAREKGKEQARERNRELFNNLTKPARPDGHAWQLKGNSVQCQNCKARLTMRSKRQALREGRQETCPMASGITFVGGQSPASDKATILRQMVEGTLPVLDARISSVSRQTIWCVSAVTSDSSSTPHGRSCKRWQPANVGMKSGVFRQPGVDTYLTAFGVKAASFSAQSARLTQSKRTRNLSQARHCRNHVVRPPARRLCFGPRKPSMKQREKNRRKIHLYG